MQVMPVGEAVAFAALIILGISNLLTVFRGRVLRIRYELAFDFLLTSILIYEAGPIYAPQIKSAYQWFETSNGNYHALLTAGCGLMAVMLYFLRKHARRAYALLEIGTGIAGLTAYPVAPPAAGQGISAAMAAWLIGGMSLIYLLVRGLDNLETGIAQSRRRLKLKMKIGLARTNEAP